MGRRRRRKKRRCHISGDEARVVKGEVIVEADIALDTSNTNICDYEKPREEEEEEEEEEEKKEDMRAHVLSSVNFTIGVRAFGSGFTSFISSILKFH